MCSGASVVESREDAGWSSFFDKIAYNLIVEVFDGGPFDLFADVFFLFGFEGQLDEDLLELLVDIVDAELFEGVVLERKTFHPGIVNKSRANTPRRSRTRRYPAGHQQSAIEIDISSLTKMPMT